MCLSITKKVKAVFYCLNNKLFASVFFYLFSKLFLPQRRDLEKFEIHCNDLLLQVKNICYILFFLFLLLNHGDIEKNSCPRKTKSERFSCCHQRINSLLTHDLEKLYLIEAYVQFTNMITYTYLKFFSILQSLKTLRLYC